MQTVKITNLTDHPDKDSSIIDIYGGSLLPGETAQIPVELLDTKINELAVNGVIGVGELPEYYALWKSPPQPTQVELLLKEQLEELKALEGPIEASSSKEFNDKFKGKINALKQTAEIIEKGLDVLVSETEKPKRGKKED